MFLKTEPFEFNGDTITLYELSALQRIEFLAFIADLHKQMPDDGDEITLSRISTEISIKTSSRIVAMSLWQASIAGPSVDDIQHEVLATWPLQAISAADYRVKTLSSMLPPEPAEVTEESGDAEETAPAGVEETDPGKSLPVS